MKIEHNYRISLNDYVELPPEEEELVLHVDYSEAIEKAAKKKLIDSIKPFRHEYQTQETPPSAETQGKEACQS